MEQERNSQWQHSLLHRTSFIRQQTSSSQALERRLSPANLPDQSPHCLPFFLCLCTSMLQCMCPHIFLLYSPYTGLSLSVPFRGTSLKILRETFPALSCIHPERLLPLPVKEASVKTAQCPSLLMWAGSFPIISSLRRNGKGTRMPLLRLEFKKDFLFFLS